MRHYRRRLVCATEDLEGPCWWRVVGPRPCLDTLEADHRELALAARSASRVSVWVAAAAAGWESAS